MFISNKKYDELQNRLEAEKYRGYLLITVGYHRFCYGIIVGDNEVIIKKGNSIELLNQDVSSVKKIIDERIEKEEFVRKLEKYCPKYKKKKVVKKK